MTLKQATAAELATDAQDFTAPIVDIVDAIVEVLVGTRKDLDFDECCRRAQDIAPSWAE